MFRILTIVTLLIGTPTLSAQDPGRSVSQPGSEFNNLAPLIYLGSQGPNLLPKETFFFQNTLQPWQSFTVESAIPDGHRVRDNSNPLASHTIRLQTWGEITIRNDFHPMQSYTVNQGPLGDYTIRSQMNPMESYTLRSESFERLTQPWSRSWDSSPHWQGSDSSFPGSFHTPDQRFDGYGFQSNLSFPNIHPISPSTFSPSVFGPSFRDSAPGIPGLP